MRKKKKRRVVYPQPKEFIGSPPKRRGGMSPYKTGAPFPRPNKPGYKEQYGVIVICHGAVDQAAIYRKLQRELKGRELKVVVT